MAKTTETAVIMPNLSGTTETSNNFAISPLGPILPNEFVLKQLEELIGRIDFSKITDFVTQACGESIEWSKEFFETVNRPLFENETLDFAAGKVIEAIGQILVPNFEFDDVVFVGPELETGAQLAMLIGISILSGRKGFMELEKSLVDTCENWKIQFDYVLAVAKGALIATKNWVTSTVAPMIQGYGSTIWKSLVEDAQTIRLWLCQPILSGIMSWNGLKFIWKAFGWKAGLMGTFTFIGEITLIVLNTILGFLSSALNTLLGTQFTFAINLNAAALTAVGIGVVLFALAAAITLWISRRNANLKEQIGSTSYNAGRISGNPASYAQGGFPIHGHPFIAREAGPELVGTLNGRNAVVNNGQIVEAVSVGVYGAFRSAARNSKLQTPAIARVFLDGKQIAMA